MLLKKKTGSSGAEFIVPSRRRCVHHCCGWRSHGCCQPWRWNRCWHRRRRRPRRKNWALLAKSQLAPVKNWHWATCWGDWRWPKAPGGRPRPCPWMAARRPSRWTAAFRCCRSKERRDLLCSPVVKARHRRNCSPVLACWRRPWRECRSCSSGPDPAATSVRPPRTHSRRRTGCRWRCCSG